MSFWNLSIFSRALRCAAAHLEAQSLEFPRALGEAEIYILETTVPGRHIARFGISPFNNMRLPVEHLEELRQWRKALCDRHHETLN